MKSLIKLNLRTRLAPISYPKFIYSLSVIQSAYFVRANRYEQEDPPPFLDPFYFFSNYKKSVQHTLEDTKIIHVPLLKTALFHSDIVVANSLLDWYSKSHAMFYALKVFDSIPQLNIISWNIMISGYNRNMLFDDSCRFFCRMHFSGFEPDGITYGSVLSACAALQSPMFGQQLYSLAIRNGFYSIAHVRTGMIDLFSKSYMFEDSLKVFYDVSCANVVCWNSIISGAVRNGENWIALDLFQHMCQKSLETNTFTFSSVLTACAILKEIDIGKVVQGLVIKCCSGDVFVGTAIIDMYAKCGDIGEAVKEFYRMPIRNVVSWTAIISGLVQGDDSISALKFFKEMRIMEKEINNFTVTSVITACARPDMIKEAIQIHSWILKTGFSLDPVVGATLINMYSKAHAIDWSETVFKEMKDVKNPGIWATMTSSFAQNNRSQQATELLIRMLEEDMRPDKFCLSSVLGVVDCFYLGKQIHCYTLKTGYIEDLSVGSSLFTMYSKCSSVEDSYKVFEHMPIKDNIAWASMISGLTEHGYANQAFELFRNMLSEGTRPDQITLSAILSSCSNLRSLKKGMEIHGYIFNAAMSREAAVGGALVTMYSKCGAMESAKKVFDMLPVKDQVACSSLLSGYSQNGQLEVAVLLFREMLMSNFTPDSFTVSSILGTTALLNRLGIGTQLHAYLTKMGLDSDVSVGSSLLTMYSKCGSIEDCCKAFDQIENPDLISWTAMIASYAQHGKGTEALKVYEQMRRQGIRPDSVTFVGVLSACSHGNLVEEGYFHLNSMTQDFGIEPNNRHYACMVDLIGRSGQLKEAEKFIKSMPIEPNALVWATLLAACRLHGDVELGRIAAREVMELNPNDDGTYVLLSNIYADLGQWEEVRQIRNMMEGTGIKKEVAWSFT